MWEDIKLQRSDETRGYVFLNPANTKTGAVDERLKSACEQYGVMPVEWGNINEKVLAELAA